MKFNFFYEELIEEQRGRPMSPEKFEAITKNIGRWLFNYFVEHPLQFARIPYFSEFREYAKSKQGPGEDADDIEELVLMVEPDEDTQSNLMYDWLNEMPNTLKAQEFIKKVGEMFEPVGKRIKYYDRPDDYIPVRGRRPKEKSEKEDEEIPSFMKVKKPKEIDVDIELGEPKRRGRKPSMNTLEKMETQYFKMYDDLEKQIRKMRELSSKINDLKKYFGK